VATIVTADRRIIGYRETGAGPALVLLHGVGSGAASWAAQLDSFAARFRVIAWDAPGYGESAPLAPATPSAADYADALASFLDALGVATAIVVGHSLGALIAASFARRHPARVRALILGDPASGYGRLEPVARAAKTRERLDLLDAHGPAGLAERRAAGLLSPAAPAAAIAKVRSVMAAIRPDGYAQAVRMLGAADIFADLPPARPTLVVWGGADRVTTPESCRAVADAIAGAERVELPGLGHACYVEDPAAFESALRAFLEKTIG